MLFGTNSRLSRFFWGKCNRYDGVGNSFATGFISQYCLKSDCLIQNPIAVQEAIAYVNVVGALITTQSGALFAKLSQQQVLR